MANLMHYGSKGERVKRLQRALNGNPFHKPNPRLGVDGEMKTRTCSAVMNVKYWAGYPKDSLDPDIRDQIAGDFLLDLLTKKRPLPADYKARRKARLAKKKTDDTPRKTLRLKALAIIKGEIGELERPTNSNHIKYNDWWGWGAVAYCVIGLSWAWVKAGSKAFVRGSRWAGCRQMLADAKTGGRGIHLTSSPVEGCPGVVDFNGDALPDHCITFLKYKPGSGKSIAVTAEFNTQKNGVGGVWYAERRASSCWWFVVEK
jgi:hypothetical protein